MGPSQRPQHRFPVKCSSQECLRLIVDRHSVEAHSYPNFTVVVETEGIVGSEYRFCSAACLLGFALRIAGGEETK